MSIDERIQLAEALWDSIPAETDTLTEGQCKELDSRLADYRHDPNAGETWDVVKALIIK
ncbi:MAG: addiction module protein [Abditibacteriaceae bacterium]